MAKKASIDEIPEKLNDLNKLKMLISVTRNHAFFFSVNEVDRQHEQSTKQVNQNSGVTVLQGVRDPQLIQDKVYRGGGLRPGETV